MHNTFNIELARFPALTTALLGRVASLTQHQHHRPHHYAVPFVLRSQHAFRSSSQHLFGVTSAAPPPPPLSSARTLLTKHMSSQPLQPFATSSSTSPNTAAAAVAASTSPSSFHTGLIVVDPTQPSDAALAPAVELLRTGNVVAFPTETVYGLGANALSGSAAARIFEAKRRPSDNPLIVHIAAWHQLPQLLDGGEAQLTPLVRRLLARFWPGPLTLIFRKSAAVPDEVSAHSDTVAVRWPAHPVAQRLIALADVPVAAPSANLSGRPSPTRATHVLHDLYGRIPCVVDGGPCAVGVESTVLNLQSTPPMVVRPGGVTVEQLRELLPDVQLYRVGSDSHFEARPPTPGLKYRHYSPRAPVALFVDAASARQLRAGNKDAAATQASTSSSPLAADSAQPLGARMTAAITARIHELTSSSDRGNNNHSDGKVTRVGLVRTHTDSSGFQYAPETLARCAAVLQLVDNNASERPAAAVARQLFSALRELDEQHHVDVILLEGVADEHEGTAVMNRASKAASTIEAV